MAGVPFVHLHLHTDYSLLDGGCEIGQLMKLAVELQMPAVAMTDHGNLFGAVEFYTAAKEKGIRPVIGCEVYVASDHRSRSEQRYNHLVLLCQNQEGYRNLIQLVSTSYLDGFYYKPRIDKDLLASHSQGLIALSACLKGEINEILKREQYDDARRQAYQYQDMFGRGNFFLEVQDHGLDDDRIVIPQLNRLSAETGIPLVATNDSHYLRAADSRAHEVLLCISTGKTMSDPSRLRYKDAEFFLKSRQDMLRSFGEMEDALDRAWEIAERCEVKLEKIKDPFPKFEVPEGHSADSYFEYIARMGFEKRRGRLEALRAAGRLKHDLPEYVERLEQEIRMIEQMKFAGYFLIVWDFIRFARSRGIPVGPGRGSAAGSLVSYSMEITDIDPLQYGLLFERFLNPERVSLPDIDIDFCTHRRGEVIQYVTEKYGREQVAQIITFGSLSAKAAIKDVGRVLDMSYGEVDKLSKLVPPVLNIKLEEAIEKEPKLRQAAEEDPRVKDLLETARRLEGFARNASVHAAGVVIAPVPLSELVPLFRTNRDEVVTQYDMKGLDKLSLLKMDFLGLVTLTVVHDSIELIERHRGIKLVIEDLPLDDAATYQIFANGYTSGVFQFESSGMRDILRRYQPERLEDLCALNALYRPGPIKGGMIDDFIERKHGRRAVAYDLPELKEIVEETYGVIVYQEQVMQIANRLAGYSLGDADLLRRAMGKKDPVEMLRQRKRFVDGARERNYPLKKVERIFDLMSEFAGYGFNKSHSAAYAYLAYVTAYLKAHYPVEFMAALLTSETGNTAKIVKYINECRERGVKVQPPDVNSSDWNFTPDGEAIRFGLGAIKNLGQNAVESIIAARRESGRFSSLDQFTEKVDLAGVNRRMIESLIKAGAMDSLGGTRAQLFAAVEGALEHGQRAWRDRLSGQTGLFAALDEESQIPDRPLPEVPDWTLQQQHAGEKEVLGFYVTGHPLDQWMEKVRELATHDSSTLEGLAKGAEVALCGILTGVERKRTKDGKAWASMRLEDLNGAADLMLFSMQYDRLTDQLVEDQAVLVRGQAFPEEGGPAKISLQEIVPLELAHVPMPSLISIRVSVGAGRAEELRRLFEQKPGNTDVRLRLEKPRDFSVVLDIGVKVRPDREFRSEIERICGPEALEVLAG